VTVEEVEISGAAAAGVEIGGADRSTVRLCYVHNNAGSGISLLGDAAPRLLGNLIAANGFRPGGAPSAAPGVEVRGGASPLMADNRIEGNSGGGVILPSAERIEEIFRWNGFGALSREQAVRVAGAAVPAASPPVHTGAAARGGAATEGPAARRHP
jgi:parallel beta-helix repeat protein